VKRYGLNTLESAKRIKTTGIGRMMAQDLERWSCPKCGGAVKFQTKACSECGFEIE
jgi:ribosomal protein S27AE